MMMTLETKCKIFQVWKMSSSFERKEKIKIKWKVKSGANSSIKRWNGSALMHKNEQHILPDPPPV